jgi:hypothetical protein
MTSIDRLAMLEAIHKGLEWRGPGRVSVRETSTKIFGFHAHTVAVCYDELYLAAFAHCLVANQEPVPTLLGFMFLFTHIARRQPHRKRISELLEEFAPSVKLTEDGEWFLNNELWPRDRGVFVVFDAAANDETARAAVLAAQQHCSPRGYTFPIFSPLSTRAWIPLGPMTMAEIAATAACNA